MSHTPHYRLVPLSVRCMHSLVEGDLAAASAEAGVALGRFFADEAWLWRIRIPQLLAAPQDAEWVARAAVALTGEDLGTAVGHIGFHGAPDRHGLVEIGYSVDPRLRRRGHARQMLCQELDRMAYDPRVRVVRASVSPENVASLRAIAGLGFERVGEQWDEEDGLEELWERRVS